VVRYEVEVGARFTAMPYRCAMAPRVFSVGADRRRRCRACRACVVQAGKLAHAARRAARERALRQRAR